MGLNDGNLRPIQSFRLGSGRGGLRRLGVASGTTPPSFSPASLSDKVAWFHGGTLGANGTAITSWTDSFNVAGAAAQATVELQPVVATTNGVKVSRHAADYLATPAFTSEPQPLTVAMLLKFAAAPVNAQIFIAGASSSEVRVYASTGTYYVQAGAGMNRNSELPALATYQTLVATFDAAASKLRVDGSEYVVPASIGTGGVTRVYIGANNAGGNATTADVAEVIILGHASDAAEVAQLETYLNAKKATLNA